ncbi:MAG: pantoate--beta-alanine ligase [Rikenellaceae bacterium]|nr:pantoate--beta-alanine ligase [Rikenellaceae bacterium]
MQIITTVAELRRRLGGRTASVGFVPTMGALHAGHISLVERCRRECDTAVVSVFVNPTQFNDPEDLVNYPRTPQADCALLEKAGVDFVFMPRESEIYPRQDLRRFEFGDLERVMEGEHRPGHFNGVAQVVSRLLEIVKPDRAYFGEKDYQQLAVIRQLVRQLHLPVEIVDCPIERDGDGLALSSRNMRLNAAQRESAPLIYATLREMSQRAGSVPLQELIRWAAQRIDTDPQLKTEYIAIADADSLQPVSSWEEPGKKYAFAAVWAGDVRLIDNIEL